MNQIGNIMALADEYSYQRVANERDMPSDPFAARQALRAAIEQALAVQPKQEPVALVEQLARSHSKCIFKAPQPQPKQEPVFWYRPRSDGFYEGPIHNAQIEKVRKESGGWHPLYTAPQPQPEKRPPNCGTGFCSCIECPYPDHFPEAGKMIEPFGYFRSTLGGWEDCAETDDGARPLYEAPQPDHFADAGKPMEREWVDLPPEEIKALANLPGAGRERTAIEMAYAVQAKLRERNGWQA